MLSAVLEALAAARRAARVHVMASHPEYFRRNPHVASKVRAGWLERRYPRQAVRYRQIRQRPPERRRSPRSGHLIEVKWAALEIPA